MQALAFFGLLSAPLGWATVTVSPLDVNNLPAAGSVSSPSVGGGSTLYFTVNDPTGQASLGPTVFQTFNPQSLAASVTNESALSNVFQVTVVSSLTTIVSSGSQSVVVFLQAAGSNTTAPQLVPIASVNGVACSLANCQGFNQGATNANSNSNSLGTNYFFAAKSVGTSGRVTLGFYPSDLCKAYGATQGGGFGGGGGIATGCLGSGSGAVATQPTAGGVPTLMQIGFSLAIADDGNATTFPATSSPLDATRNNVNFSFQVNTPTLQCPASGTVGMDSVFVAPGDKQVSLNTQAFSLNQVSQGDAPAQNFLVFGNPAKGPDPVIGADYASLMPPANQLFSVVPYGSNAQVISGLPNNIDYTLSFFIQDAAGNFAGPGAQPNTCFLTPVTAAAIEGFYPQNTNSDCFIATAAYQSADVWPVRLLREFRERVLRKSGLGRWMIAWYGRLGPPAADWLMHHPVWRGPVLVALAPVEGLAWLALHPLSLGLGWGVWLMALAWAWRRGWKKQQQSGIRS